MMTCAESGKMNNPRTRGKQEERRIAELFGTNRRGIMGLSGSDASSECPISIECKNSGRNGIYARWIDQAREQGQKEKKPWILTVRRKGDHKFTVTCDGEFFLKLWNDSKLSNL